MLNLSDCQGSSVPICLPIPGYVIVRRVGICGAANLGSIPVGRLAGCLKVHTLPHTVLQLLCFLVDSDGFAAQLGGATLPTTKRILPWCPVSRDAEENGNSHMIRSQ